MHSYTWEAVVLLPLGLAARIVMIPVWLANLILMRLYNQLPIYVFMIPAGVCSILLMLATLFVRAFAALSRTSAILRPIGFLLALPFLIIGLLAGDGVPPVAMLGSGMSDKSFANGISNRLKALLHFPFVESDD